MKKNISFLFLIIPLLINAQEKKSPTTFKYGGYIKADFINTWYENGDVDATNALRDFHLPSQIPVGPKDGNFDLDYHVKETRFNFDVLTKILDKEIHGFIEMDFMMSSSGDEKVTNSFNPRIRHAYFEWDQFLIGQTWSTFMVVTLPDEIDFTGAMDGLVFIRQPQIRYKAGSWWFALENPETTINAYQGSASLVTDFEIAPDIVVRKNFEGKRTTWSIAAIGRTLHYRNTTDNKRHSTAGFGITSGGKILVGKKGDDFRMVTTFGSGLGRYLAAGFGSAAMQTSTGSLEQIETLNGYIAYNHYWKPKTLSSSISIAAYKAKLNANLVAAETNEASYSISGNLKWDPIPQMRLGVEYMYGQRQLLAGVFGGFHRLQFAAKYTFGYSNSNADEKR